MSKNKDMFSKISAEKWYLVDGKGKQQALSAPPLPTNSVQNDLTSVDTQKLEYEVQHKEKDKENNEMTTHTLDTLEPEWNQEDPKNCFNPF